MRESIKNKKKFSFFILSRTRLGKFAKQILLGHSAREKIDKSKRGTLQCAPTLVVLITIISIIAIILVGCAISRPETKTELLLFINSITGKGNTQTLQEPPIIIDLNTLGMSALEAQADHDCSRYLVSKYDTTNHWEECTECGTKYNVTAHVYTETWTMGESCHSDNKCNHVCACGYSYQSNNTRKHTSTPLYTRKSTYSHYKLCKVCGAWIYHKHCTKEDGTEINCTNLGTCVECGYEYSQINHYYDSYIENGDIECAMCGTYIGTVSNFEKNYLTSNTVEWSLDFSVTDTGNFEGSTCNTTCTMTKNSETSIHIIGNRDIRNEEITTFVYTDINKYYASTDDYVEMLQMRWVASPDQDPPVINTDIEQTDLATSNGWATQKRITVTGTENFCSSVKLTLKDSDGNTYLNNAAVSVTDNAWSYTFTPDIEADENGKEFTIIATDNLGNSSEQTFMVYKTDKKAPTMTSPGETSQDWTTEKEWTFTATDSGSGGVQISIGDLDHYTLATKSNGVYSKPYTFTGDTYGSKDVKVYFKDGLGNTKEETIKVYNIDTTAPTITNHEIVNKEIVLTGNDINTTLNKEGAGISEYRYMGSSKENETLGQANTKTTTSNKIPLTEFARVKYAYIQAVDRAGNTSEVVKITLPTYQITVNPNGGKWREKTESTILNNNYQNAQSITIENPEREGYNFKNWTASAGTITGTSYTFTVENGVLTANWEPRTDTAYTVKHWQEKLNTGNTGTVPRAPTDENKSVNNIENNNQDDVGAGLASARK